MFTCFLVCSFFFSALESGKQKAHKLKKSCRDIGQLPGTPGGTNRVLPAAVPGIACGLQKTQKVNISEHLAEEKMFAEDISEDKGITFAEF